MGNNPVGEIALIASSILSGAVHAKASLKTGGGAANPKDSLGTDSEPVPGGKGEKNPEWGVK